MRRALLPLATLLVLLGAATARAQSFGVELHNTLMPAAGGMGGVSVARPQDLVSGLNANPATLTQFQGSQFTFGRTRAEATFNLSQTSDIPTGGCPALYC